MKPILSIDYGKVKIGLAISDELRLLAHPLKVIKNNPAVIDEIVDIIIKYNVEKVIVGIPYWDKPMDIVDEIKSFAEKIKSRLNIEVILVNEFYSTKIAQQKLVSIGKKLKKYKKKLDTYAACVILQDYLDTIERKEV